MSGFITAFSIAFVCSITFVWRNRKKRVDCDGKKSPRAGIVTKENASGKCRLAMLAARTNGCVYSLSDAVRFREKYKIDKDTTSGGIHRKGSTLAIYPGSFNPPSSVHVDVVRRVCDMDSIQAVWLDMTIHRTKKKTVGQVIDERQHMAELSVKSLPKAGVTCLMSQLGDAGWGPEYFDVMRCLTDCDKIAWVMGSDVLEGMKSWKIKARRLLLHCDQLIVCQRGHSDEDIISIVREIVGNNKHDNRLVILPADRRLESMSSSALRGGGGGGGGEMSKRGFYEKALKEDEDGRMSRMWTELQNARRKGSDKLRGDLCNNIAHAYVLRGQYKNALFWAKMDLRLCKRRRDVPATIIGLRVCGEIFRHNRDVHASLKYLFDALKLCQSRMDHDASVTVDHLQGVHTEIGNSTREISHTYREGDSILHQKWADRYLLASGRHYYASMRLAYNKATQADAGNVDAALTSIDHIWVCASDAFFNYGNFLIDMMLPHAQTYFELALHAARRASDGIRQGRAHHGLGDVMMSQRRYEDAARHYSHDATHLRQHRSAPIFERRATLLNCVRSHVQAEGGLVQAARSVEELRRLDRQDCAQETLELCEVVRRLQQERSELVDRAKLAAKTVEDVVAGGAESVRRQHQVAERLCRKMADLSAAIDRYVDERTATQTMHSLRVRCAEGRARIVHMLENRASSGEKDAATSRSIEAAHDAGVARLNAAEFSPEPCRTEHVCHAVKWLRTVAKLSSDSTTAIAEDVQLEILISLGDAHSLRSKDLHMDALESLVGSTSSNDVSSDPRLNVHDSHDFKLAVSSYRQAYHIAARHENSQLAYRALNNLFVHFTDLRQFSDATQIERQLQRLDREANGSLTSENLEDTGGAATSLPGSDVETEYPDLFAGSFTDPRLFAISRDIVGKDMLPAKRRKKIRKRRKEAHERVANEKSTTTMSTDNTHAKRARTKKDCSWDHEVATCSASYVGEWDGAWEPCHLIEKIGNQCHVICRADGKDVFVPSRLVRLVCRGGDRASRHASNRASIPGSSSSSSLSLPSSASEWYVSTCVAFGLKASDFLRQSLRSLDTAAEKSSSRGENEKCHKYSLSDGAMNDAHVGAGLTALARAAYRISELVIRGNFVKRPRKIRASGTVDALDDFIDMCRRGETRIRSLGSFRIVCHALHRSRAAKLMQTMLATHPSLTDVELSLGARDRGAAFTSSSPSSILLATDTNLSNLRRLDLRGSDIRTRVEITSLARTLCSCENLEELDLSRNPLDDLTGLRSLAGTIHGTKAARRLRVLRLRAVEAKLASVIGDFMAPYRAPGDRRAFELDLSQNELDELDCASVSGALRRFDCATSTLLMDDCGLTASKVRALESDGFLSSSLEANMSSSSRPLEHVSLRSNPSISGAALNRLVRTLLTSPHFSVRTLDLFDCNVSLASDGIELFRAIANGSESDTTEDRSVTLIVGGNVWIPRDGRFNETLADFVTSCARFARRFRSVSVLLGWAIPRADVDVLERLWEGQNEMPPGASRRLGSFSIRRSNGSVSLEWGAVA
eukprot:g2075.t1